MNHQTNQNEIKTEKKLEICQNSEMVKTEKIYKLGPKICTLPPPRFWERKTRATPGYGRQLGLPLSYSRTQRTLLHQTHKCGYKHLYCAKLASFDILLFIVKFLKLFIL